MIAGAVAKSCQVEVWDLPTRIFHWTLVVLVFAGWGTSEWSQALHDPTLKFHRWAGYGILVVMGWRVLWGFFGPPASRFSHFIAKPGVALAYGRDVIAGASRRFLGHNPLGGYMVLALLVILIAEAGLGLFVVDRDELANGPLYKLIDPTLLPAVRHWHRFIFYRVILPLAGLHILANAYYQFVKRDPLIRAMITGQKPAGSYEDQADASEPGPSPARALLCLSVSAAFVFGTIIALGGKI